MSLRNTYPEFSDFEVKLVRDAVRRMMRGGLFASQDREDLEQELMLYIWQKKKELPMLESVSEDPVKAMITTFVNSKIKELVRLQGECSNNEVHFSEIFNRSREHPENESVLKVHLESVLKKLSDLIVSVFRIRFFKSSSD